MRRFFFDLLSKLDKLTGMKQMEKMQSCENPEKEIGELLDILCRVSDQFPIIPKKDQQAIINQAVISDAEFKGLNAHIVYKWLSANKDRYFREVAHIPNEQDPDWRPVEGEQRQEWLKRWAQSLEGFAEKVEPRSHVRELEATLPPKEKGIVYHSTGPEAIFERELHLQYVRENYDPLTREKLPTWIGEQEWTQRQLEK